MSDRLIENAKWFLFGWAFVLLLLALFVFVSILTGLPLAGLTNAFPILTLLFAVAGAGAGIFAGLRGGIGRA